MAEKIIFRKEPTLTLPKLQLDYAGWKAARMLFETPSNIAGKQHTESAELVVAASNQGPLDIAGEAADLQLFTNTIITNLSVPLTGVIDYVASTPLESFADLQQYTDLRMSRDGTDSVAGIADSIFDRTELIMKLTGKEKVDERFVVQTSAQIFLDAALILRHLGLPIGSVVDGKLLRNEIKYDEQELRVLRQLGNVAEGAMCLAKQKWNPMYDKILLLLQLGHFDKVNLK